MPLAWLSNFAAFYEPDPVAQSSLRQVWLSHFDRIEVIHDWVLGIKALPGDEPFPAEALQAGLFFAEGETAMRRGFQGQKEEFYKELIKVVETAPETLDQFPGDFAFLYFKPGGELIGVRSA